MVVWIGRFWRGPRREFYVSHYLIKQCQLRSQWYSGSRRSTGRLGLKFGQGAVVFCGLLKVLLTVESNGLVQRFCDLSMGSSLG